MNVGMRFEIHFHQQDEASVFLESSSSGDDERFGEVLLASFFTARMLANLGPTHPSANSLAYLLGELDGNLEELADHEAADGARLTQYQGSKGRKGFRGTLIARDENLNFQMHPWGFGMFGRGIGYYAPNSVVLLLRHLARRRRRDDEYVGALEEALELVADAWTAGRVTVANQHKVAMTATALGCANFYADAG